MGTGYLTLHSYASEPIFRRKRRKKNRARHVMLAFLFAVGTGVGLAYLLQPLIL